MRSSQTISEIAKALNKAQGELENPTKNAKGYGYTYANLAEIINVIKEPLEKNGLSIIHTMDWGDCPKVSTTLLHSSGEWLSCDCRLAYRASEKTNEMQAIGSSITYGRKYNIQCLLNLYAEDDDGKASNGTGYEKQPFEEVKFEPKKQAFPDRKMVTKPRISVDQVRGLEQMIANRTGLKEKIIKWQAVNDLNEILAENYEQVLNSIAGTRVG